MSKPRGNTGRAKTSANRIKADERMIRAVEMRLAGESLDVIAESLGYSGPPGACEAVKTVLKRRMDAAADSYREVQDARYDELLKAVWEDAVEGDLDALNAVLKIEAQRARVLGLERKDMPVKVPGLPKLESVGDGRKVISLLLEKVANGELSASEAEGMVSIAARHTGELEKTDLADQLAELRELAQANYDKEKANAKNQGHQSN